MPLPSLRDIRKTTLYLLGLDHLSSLEKSLDSLWHLKVQPQFYLKLKFDPSEPKWEFKSLVTKSVSHKSATSREDRCDFFLSPLELRRHVTMLNSQHENNQRLSNGYLLSSTLVGTLSNLPCQRLCIHCRAQIILRMRSKSATGHRLVACVLTKTSYYSLHNSMCLHRRY